MASAAAPAGFFNSLTIDRNSRIPFYQQLYEAIRQQIETGVLPDHYKLPPAADLVSRLQIPRTTVRRAIEKLETEKYLESWGNSGYRVCRRADKAVEKPVPEVTAWIPPEPEPYRP